MNRRVFVTGLGVVLAAPLASEAQQAAKVYTIGVMHVNPQTGGAEKLYEAFREELRDTGWIEGQNIKIERRSAEGRSERVAELIAQLVNLRVDVIVATEGAIQEAKTATSTIPIVMVSALNPVGRRLIETLSRPGRNLTGTMWDPAPEIVGKYLEMLKASIARLSRVLLVWNPTFPGLDTYVPPLEDAALRLGLILHKVPMSEIAQLGAVTTAVRLHRAQAVVVYGSPLMLRYAREIVQEMRRERIPDVWVFREAVVAGALMSYGVSMSSLWRGACPSPKRRPTVRLAREHRDPQPRR
jgi:putative tryptophan/tyrosine transport system substrate-binding protein